MLEEKEIWKDVVCYNGMFKGLYQVSNLGRVRTAKGKLKKVSLMGKNSYPRVNLCKDGKYKSVCIHILVAQAFIPNPENKPYVDHINTDRSDFRISNLRWVTPKENSNNPITKKRNNEATHTPDALARGLETKKKRNTKTSPKTIYQFTLEGDFIATFESSRDAMRKTGIYNVSIRQAVRGDKASAGGYLWSETMIPPKYEPYKSKRKRVGQYDKDMNLIKEWDSIGEAANALGLCDSNISRAIYGRTTKKCCGGFKWRFI